MSAILTLAVHAHVPWRRGTGAEAAPRLQPGGARGWAARIPQERACAPGTCAPGTCESVLCLFPRASTPQACIQAGLSVHTHAHTSVHQTQHHAHTSRTHTHRHAHTRHHIHMHSCVQTRHHGHTPSCAHARLCTLPRVHLAGGGLVGGLALLFLRRKTPPRTAGHRRTTPHAHSSCYQHPIQKTVLIRKSANGSLQLLIASLIWDFFQGITE